MQKWKLINEREVMRAVVFKYSQKRMQSPLREDVQGDFDIVTCANWVNVIALTKSGKLLMVRQYRAGTDEVTLELPAGALERGEDPLLAAQRELREETGHTSHEWVHVGDLSVNPAFMTNSCHVYLARECEETHPLELDELEEIEVLKRPLYEAFELFKNGSAKHSLSVASIGLAFMKGELSH